MGHMTEQLAATLQYSISRQAGSAIDFHAVAQDAILSVLQSLEELLPWREEMPPFPEHSLRCLLADLNEEDLLSFDLMNAREEFSASSGAVVERESIFYMLEEQAGLVTGYHGPDLCWPEGWSQDVARVYQAGVRT